MSLAAAEAGRPGALRLLARTVKDAVFGTVLCLNPVTSVLVLGWLMRRMRAQARGEARPGWILGDSGRGPAARIAGGLAANIRAGLVTGAGLASLTLPFSALWLFAWWAGWENSFNKGYEQAWVGPVTGFGACLVAVVVLTFLPYALAHHAVEGRFGAFFEWRRIRHAAALAGWRGVGLAVLTVLLAFPHFLGRALPVFVEEIVPEFPQRPPEEQAAIADLAALITAAYAFAALTFLRGMAMRLYLRTCEAVALSRLAIFWIAIQAVVWFGLVALIFVGQFMNHAWALWLTHPFFLLPWPG